MKAFFIWWLLGATACATEVFSLPFFENAPSVFEHNENDTIYRNSDILLDMDEIRKRVWYLGYGSFVQAKPEETQRGYSSETFGLLVGVDRQVGRFGMVGFGLGGDWSSIERKDKLFSSEISTAKALVHASLGSERWYAEFEGGYTGGQYKSSHRAKAGSALQHSSQWRNAWRFGAEIGCHWEREFSKTEPFFTVQRTNLENSDGGDVTTIAAIGCRHNWRFAGPLVIARPGIFGGYLHQFGDELFTSGTWIPNATYYEVPDGKLYRDRFFLGMNLNMSMRKSMDVYFKYSTELARDYDAHTILCGMNWNF